MQEMQETWVQSLGQDDPLVVGNGNPFQYTLPRKLHGQEELSGYSPESLRELDTTKHLCMSISDQGWLQGEQSFLILRREHIRTAVDQWLLIYFKMSSFSSSAGHARACWNFVQFCTSTVVHYFSVRDAIAQRPHGILRAAHNREAFMFRCSQYLTPVLRQERFLPYSERLEILHHGGDGCRIPWLDPVWTGAGFSLSRLWSLPRLSIPWPHAL